MGAMDSREAMGELMQYCWVAATAVHKFNTGRISEDELGHLVQVPPYAISTPSSCHSFVCGRIAVVSVVRWRLVDG